MQTPLYILAISAIRQEQQPTSAPHIQATMGQQHPLPPDLPQNWARSFYCPPFKSFTFLDV